MVVVGSVTGGGGGAGAGAGLVGVVGGVIAEVDEVLLVAPGMGELTPTGA